RRRRICAVSVARTSGLDIHSPCTARSGSRQVATTPRPRALNGMSERPCRRRAAVHSVGPCLSGKSADMRSLKAPVAIGGIVNGAVEDARCSADVMIFGNEFLGGLTHLAAACRVVEQRADGGS